MTRGNTFKFSIAAIMIVTAAVAVLLKFGPVFQVIFVFAQVAFVVFGTNYMLDHLPRRIAEIRRRNCIRADGSRSSHRSSVENREWSGLRGNVRTVFAVLMLPFTLILLYPYIPQSVVFVGSLAWLVLGFLVLRSGYLYYLNKYVFDLKRRAQQYKIRDLDLIIASEELAASPTRLISETQKQ